MSFIKRKFDFTAMALFLILTAAFLVSLFLYFAANFGKRYIFRFESVDKGKNAIEHRILPFRDRAEEITMYVDELLLGPIAERSRPIFSPGTKAKFCFVREKTLYINLSSDLLYKTGNAGDIMDGIRLFKKNIFKTFPYVQQIELYIDGKSIYEENDKK